MNKMLKEIIEEINPFDEFDEETDLLGEGILDSLSLMIFIERIEKLLNITIPESEVTLENFSTLNTVLVLIEKIK